MTAHRQSIVEMYREAEKEIARLDKRVREQAEEIERLREEWHDLANQCRHEFDRAERLRGALRAIAAEADCTKNLAGDCVGPTIRVHQSSRPIEVPNCAKHFALAALTPSPEPASALASKSPEESPGSEGGEE
jgi:predicted nuclease with TOPRIM domain